MLADELDELRRQLGRRGTVGSDRGRSSSTYPSASASTFARAFDTRLVDSTTTSWEHWFGLLERFATREGHTRIPASYVEDGHRLGKWVSKQRAAHGAGRTSAERIGDLRPSRAGSGTRGTPDWEVGFSQVERFATREGHTRVPASYVEDGHRLGAWVTTQRAVYRKGQLPAERISPLEAIPGWVWDPWDANWEVGFSLLERFATREGHTRIPQQRVEDGYRLGAWVTTQRAVYRRGQLPAERISPLEALPGWVWDPWDANWEVGFSHLERFATREGHTRVPAGYVEDGYRLGQWVKTQCVTYRAGRLSGERAARLKALPGWNWGTPRRPST